MAAGSASKKKTVVHLGTEPHFHVTDAHYELASDGTVHVSCYEEVRGELRLCFTATIVPRNLVKMGRDAMHAGADGHNMTQWAKMIEEEDGASSH